MKFLEKVRAVAGLTIPVLSSESTPDSGEVAIYAKSDGKIYKKNSSGTESEIAASAGLSAYPVGSIYLAVVSTNPATFFGGTWVTWGTGRVPVAIDTSQTEFNTVEKTGGEKTHMQTLSEVADHAHLQTTGYDNGTVYVSEGTSYTASIVVNAYRSNASFNPRAAATTRIDKTWGRSARGVQSDPSSTPTVPNPPQTATPNLQPYITCYMWKRTA